VELIINNWDKYNPKRDQKSYTWLRLSNDIGTQSDLFGMTAEMKFIWILLLCEASKKNSGDISIKSSYLSHISQCSDETIEKTVKHLESEGIVTLNSYDTVLPRDDVTTTPTNVRTYERTPVAKDDIPFKEIIDHLNTRLKSTFKISTVKSRDCVKARWNEDCSLEDFKKVVDAKMVDYLKGGFEKKYLRPETLFGNKFDGYLQEYEPKHTELLDGITDSDNDRGREETVGPCGEEGINSIFAGFS